MWLRFICTVHIINMWAPKCTLKEPGGWELWGVTGTRALDSSFDEEKWLRLTARAMTAVIMPVLSAVVTYGDPNVKCVTDGGFSPFFRSPICRPKKIKKNLILYLLQLPNRLANYWSVKFHCLLDYHKKKKKIHWDNYGGPLSKE